MCLLINNIILIKMAVKGEKILEKIETSDDTGTGDGGGGGGGGTTGGGGKSVASEVPFQDFCG